MNTSSKESKPLALRGRLDYFRGFVVVVVVVVVLLDQTVLFGPTQSIAAAEPKQHESK